jgi:hypothetical protein
LCRRFGNDRFHALSCTCAVGQEETCAGQGTGDEESLGSWDREPMLSADKGRSRHREFDCRDVSVQWPEQSPYPAMTGQLPTVRTAAGIAFVNGTAHGCFRPKVARYGPRCHLFSLPMADT